MTIDDTMKLAELEREIEMRRHVYPMRVKKGLLTQYQADKQIAILQAIAADYRAKLQSRLPFNEPFVHSQS